MKDPSPSPLPPSPPRTDINGSDIPSLDAFGRLTLEPAVAVADQRPPRDHPDGASACSTGQTAQPDERDDDYSARLSDVFIDFGGELRAGLHSTTGAVDDPDATIVIEDAWSLPPPSGPIPEGAGGQPAVVTLSRSARHLIDQLSHPHTCSREHHALLLHNHLHKVQNHRHTNAACGSVADLQQLIDPTLPRNSYIPDVLGRNDVTIAGRYTYLNDRPADPLVFSDEHMLSGRFRTLYEGRENDSTKPQNVCLHLHTSSRLKRRPTSTVDIDSASGFATSLAVFRNGLDWVMKPHRVRNMSSNIHGVRLSTESEGPHGDARRSSVPVHEVPHMHLGTGVGLFKIEAYALFPRIRDRASNFLLDSEEELWYDEIWMPALIHTMPGDGLQEMPMSWRAAVARSKAKGLESYSTEETTFYSRQRLLSIILQPQYLHEIWLEVSRRLAADVQKYHIFQDCRLFLNSKGLKMQLKSNSWLGLSRSWNRLWDVTIDPAHIDQSSFWLDIGRQLTPPDQGREGGSDDAAQFAPETYLWRRCCLNSYIRQRRQGHPKSDLRVDVYQSASFHDVLSVTLTPSPKSAEHVEGFRYSQFYMKDNVNFIAEKTTLFANSDVESLALDPNFVKATTRNSGSPKPLSARRLTRAYLAGKVRAHSSLQEARIRSFAAREDHRLSLDLWSQVFPVLIQQEQEETMFSDVPAELEEPFFMIPSSAYFGVLYGQMNKFCLGFEYMLSRVDDEYTAWEDTQAAIIFFRSLQRSFSTSIVQQEPALWKDRWRRQIGPDKPPTTHQGLNIGALSARTGFGWFSPLFDWGSWRLKDPYVPLVLQENPRLLRHYQVHRVSLRDKHSIFMRLQLVERWWQKYGSTPGFRLAIIEYLCGLCIAQFRRDVWAYLLWKRAVSREHKLHLMNEDVPLCHHVLYFLT